MDFFGEVFGFEEGEYTHTQALFQQLATLTPAVALEGPFYAAESSSSLDCNGPDASELLLSGRSASDAETLLTGERCVFRVPVNPRNPKDRAMKELDAGIFSAPSVRELRERVAKRCAALTASDKALLLAAAQQVLPSASSSQKNVFLRNICGDSRSLHLAPEYQHAVVQAASQFNYLEFPSSSTVPEKGIRGYIFDRTQGPACAIACLAGTAYRNYLLRVPKRDTALTLGEWESVRSSDVHPTRGQTRDRQSNGLADVTAAFLRTFSSSAADDAAMSSFYTVKNGYVDTDKPRIHQLNEYLRDYQEPFFSSSSRKSQQQSWSPEDPFDEFMSLLRVGVQEGTTITDEGAGCVRSKDPESKKGTWSPLVDPFTVPQNFRLPEDVRHTEVEPTRLVPKCTQVYCSALSIGYSRIQIGWTTLACIVLNGCYEATLLIGILNTLSRLEQLKQSWKRLQATQPMTSGAAAGKLLLRPEMLSPALLACLAPPVLLTKVGGGVFANHADWIQGAMRRAVQRVEQYGVPLDVRIVHYSAVEDGYDGFVKSVNNQQRASATAQAEDGGSARKRSKTEM